MLDLKFALAGTLAGLVIGAIAGWAIKGWQTGAVLQAKDRQIAEMVADHAARQTEAIEKTRALEQAREEEKRKLEDEHRTTVAALERDIDGLRGTAASLRREAKAFADRAKPSSNSESELGSASASEALDLLAELLTGAEDRAREIAEFADRAHAAGVMCEQQYDSLARDNAG